MSSKHVGNRKNIPVLCTICEHEFLTDISYCQQCRQTLCISCVKTHDKFSLLKDHNILNVSKIEECKREVSVENTTDEEIQECTDNDKDFNPYDYAYTDIQIQFKRQAQLRNFKPHSDLTECKREFVVEGTSDENSGEWIKSHDVYYIKSSRRENEQQTSDKGKNLEANISAKDQNTNESEMEPPLVPPRVTHKRRNEDKTLWDEIKYFHVEVQYTPLAARSNVVGGRVLAVGAEKMFIEDADSKVTIATIPFKLIRKFSNQTFDVFRIEVGRKFEHGEGTINCKTDEANTIFNLMELNCRNAP